MKYKKPNLFVYCLTQVAAWFVATFIFGRKILRNEIKGKKGPYVIIANHEAALDFVNLIGITSRRMTFVISNSIYSTLPVKCLLDKLGVIPKQQFQSTLKDLKRIKNVIDSGNPLVIYPAGLMCEDGLSTPIPSATYKFLKWLNADVYVARSQGTYFAMPKWSKAFRPGKTYIDIYKLFSKEELAEMDLDTVKQKTNSALIFDAYREQELLRIKYLGNNNIEGLENVLYMCPHCHSEFTMQVKNKSTIHCTHCGYELTADEYAFLHNYRHIGKDIRYVSDWSALIYSALKEKIENGLEKCISSKTKIHMIDHSKHKFIEVGNGTVCLSQQQFVLNGTINGSKSSIRVPIATVPALPFSPGKYFEIQYGENIYRCVLENGKYVMKFINMLKIFYELNMTVAI